MKKTLDVLVVGGGMYVAGKGTQTNGTIMPALLEGRRNGIVGKLGIVTTSLESSRENIERVHQLAGRMGVESQCEAFPKVGASHTAYLDAAQKFKPDAVIISVPDHLHATISIALIEKGLHCLVVKPMASTLKEAQAMVEAAERAQVVAQVEFHKRYDESNILLYDAVQSGKLGDLLYAVIEYSQQKKSQEMSFDRGQKKPVFFNIWVCIM